MWGRLKQFLGVIPDFTDSEEVIRALHGDVVKRNFLFHIFIIMFECVMVISISMRPGGPFCQAPQSDIFCFVSGPYTGSGRRYMAGSMD